MKLYLTIAVGILSIGLISNSLAVPQSIITHKVPSSKLLTPCSKCPDHCCGLAPNTFCCTKSGR